jgi:uncharacterized membrane protein YphA (DoxX/SURF4 family)
VVLAAGSTQLNKTLPLMPKVSALLSAGPLFGPPGYEVALLYIAGLFALILWGPGIFSADVIARKISDRKKSTPGRV